MPADELKRTYLADYSPPPFLVPEIKLELDLDPDSTTVVSMLNVQPAAQGAGKPLVLYGNRLELESVHLNEQRLVYDEYRLEGENLIIDRPPGDEFTLRIVNRVRPKANKALMGLYRSGDSLTTQCEAQGFRSIAFFPDRPDVLSRYTVKITACKSAYPVILSNGERIDSGDLGDGRHYAIWHDPFPKPCYLFAMVAGKLGALSDTFVTRTGKNVLLEFYAPEKDLDKCAWALDCLKRAMRWDEQAYGREYDLNRFMVVAIEDFNMGAMENKALNIFNSKYVYAKPDTATDLDYHSVEAVIAHEYFHNWSGNRVTLRDWFQLSLKEGFTIYREQQFSADMGSATVQRIRDANMIKVHQFREDAGPTAHPVQPDSFVTINNFYTLTIYNKGAELIRMLHVMLGPETYRKGTDLYFDRHDGKAATIQDFVQAMEDASGVSLQQFKRWYKTPGTPAVKVEHHFDPESGTFTLAFEQSLRSRSEPLQIPVKTALLGPDGQQLALRLDENACDDSREVVLEVAKERQTFKFYGLDSEPVPSLLRGFSAPVELSTSLNDRQLCLLMAADTDGYSRWDAAQTIAKNCILALIEGMQDGRTVKLNGNYLEAFETVLKRAGDDPALASMVLGLPSEISIGQAMEVIDPHAVHHARKSLVRQIAARSCDLLLETYRAFSRGADECYSAEAAGRRSLRNLCLSYLNATGSQEAWTIAYRQFKDSRNMTDRAAALQIFAESDSAQRHEIIDAFYSLYAHDPLIIDKWLRIQAAAPRDDTLQRVVELTRHPSFSIEVPNRVSALIGAFCNANPYCFHAADGSGYDLLADYVLKIDPHNPQLAARLAEGFSEIRRYGDTIQMKMRERLERISCAPSLSVDLAEMVEMMLKPFAGEGEN